MLTPAPRPRFRALALVVTGVLGGCLGADDSDDVARRSRTPASAEECLSKAGLKVTGVARARGDRDAPDFELIVGSRFPWALIAFYDDLGRAARFEPEIRKRAPRFPGSVVRRGKTTIIWTRKPSMRLRARVSRCV